MDDTERVELAYEDAGSGAPVVLLHAFPLASGMWSAQREGLSARFRVITPDQRGFGGSRLGDAPPSLDVAADDLAALLDRLSLGRIVLGGISMGGYVAMAFLRRHPGRSAGLVLVDTKATADTEAAAANRRRIADEVERGDSSALLLDEVYPKLLGATTKASRPEVASTVADMVAAAPPRAVAWAQRAMANRPDSTATLSTVEVPALVVVGEEDELTVPADAEAMASLLPKAQLAKISGAGHLSPIEAPAAVNSAIADFVAAI